MYFDWEKLSQLDLYMFLMNIEIRWMVYVCSLELTYAPW